MIYTVAKRDEAEKGLDEKASKGERLFKVGLSAVGQKRSPGGAVWRTIEDVQAWLDRQAVELDQHHLPELQSLAIYGVEADWEKHTIQHDDEPFRRLVVDRPMCRVSHERKT